MDAQVWVFSHVSVTASVQMWYSVQYGCACVYTRDCGCQHAIVVVCLQFQLHQNAFVFVFVFVHAYLMCYNTKKVIRRLIAILSHAVPSKNYIQTRFLSQLNLHGAKATSFL